MEKKYVVSGKKGEEKYEVFTLQGEDVYIYKNRVRSLDGKKISCRICGKLKLSKDFSPDGKGNFHPFCKECNKKYQKRRREEGRCKKHGRDDYTDAQSVGIIKGIISRNFNIKRKDIKIDFPKSLIEFETLCRETGRHARTSKKLNK